jgi:hypothetical protein
MVSESGLTVFKQLEGGSQPPTAASGQASFLSSDQRWWRYCWKKTIACQFRKSPSVAGERQFYYGMHIKSECVHITGTVMKKQRATPDLLCSMHYLIYQLQNSQWGWGHLTSKHEALSSYPSAAKKEKKKNHGNLSWSGEPDCCCLVDTFFSTSF